MHTATARFHQYPLLWLLLVGSVCVGLLIAIDQRYMAAVFAADRSYLCILILVIFVAASLHVGIHTLSVARELERSDDYLSGNRLDRARSAAGNIMPRRFGLMPQPVLEGFVIEMGHKDEANDQTGNIRQQTLEIYADRLRAPVEIGWYIVDILIRLGLIGTIIGFILIFASLGDGPKPNSGNIQDLLFTMSGGMGTALYTTLLGLISATLLGTQYMILGRSVERLIASLIRLGRELDSDGGS